MQQWNAGLQQADLLYSRMVGSPVKRPLFGPAAFALRARLVPGSGVPRGFSPAQAAACSVSVDLVLLFLLMPSPTAAADGWNALLDPSIAGKLVLPSSPRVVLSIAERMDRPDALQRLRAAALVFDDRHALNWLLQGKARAAVLPLVRCMATLRSDPRVHAVLPEQGAPLHWTLLMRPAQTREPLPQSWMGRLKAPLMGRLLGDGWVLSSLGWIRRAVLYQ